MSSAEASLISTFLCTGIPQTPPRNNLIKDQHGSDSTPSNTILLVPESQQIARNNIIYTNISSTTD